MVMITLYAKQEKRHRGIEQTFGLWEKVRVGCFKRTVSKHVYYLGWKRSPAQVGCMRQVLGPGALGRPRGIGRRGRWEGGSGWGIHVKPWLILANVWQKPLQYCKVISLQLIKKNSKKKINLFIWLSQALVAALRISTFIVTGGSLVAACKLLVAAYAIYWYFPDHGSNPVPLLGEHKVLATVVQ